VIPSQAVPSPIAHGLAGLAIAHISLVKGWARPPRLFWIAALGFAAIAPDLDFVPGLLIGQPYRFHHGPTHSLFAVLVFGVMTATIARLMRIDGLRWFGVLMAMGYLSHLLLDAFTVETNQPFGMPIFWPLTNDPLRMPFHLFLDIQSEKRTGNFLANLMMWHNARAIAREILIMGGLWVVYWASLAIARTRPPSREAPARRSDHGR